jgi:hypothetical protein
MQVGVWSLFGASVGASRRRLDVLSGSLPVELEPGGEGIAGSLEASGDLPSLLCEVKGSSEVGSLQGR